MRSGSQSPFPYWPVEKDEARAETFRDHHEALLLCRLAGEQKCQFFSESGNVNELFETGLQHISFSYEANRGASVSGSIAVGRLPVIDLLRGSLHRFDRVQHDRLIEELSAVAARQESYDSLDARQYLIEQNSGWRIHLAALLREMSSAENECPGLFWNRLTDAEVRTLIVQAALQGYVDDHGRFPATLDALVPRYLTEIPENPFGDGQFGYQADEMKYEITSSGSKPVVRYASKGLPPAALPLPPRQSARHESGRPTTNEEWLTLAWEKRRHRLCRRRIGSLGS